MQLTFCHNRLRAIIVDMRFYTAEQSVERGAALLDQKEPDWFNRVNPGTLNLLSINYCVLGQLYGGYANGLKEVGLKGPGWSYGFLSVFHMTEVESAWREAIVQRRLIDKIKKTEKAKKNRLFAYV